MCILAFGADKYNQWKQEKLKTAEEKEADMAAEEIKIKKTHLRKVAKAKGENVVIEIAQGISNGATNEVKDEEQ